jgi:prohibitin 2
MSTGKWVTYIIVVVVLLICTISSIVIVPAGNIGIHLTFGKVVGTFNEGLSIKMPIIDGVKLMSTRTLLYADPKSAAASKDMQDVTTEININYRIDPNYAGLIYQTLGEDYIKIVGHPVVQETVKEVTAKFIAEDMIQRRTEVKDAIEYALKERFLKHNILVSTVNIVNFTFSSQFSAAIESKMAAAQKVLEAEQRLRQAEVEARQAETQAKGIANAAIARAEGQAKAANILSNAIKGNSEYLQYLYIDKLGPTVTTVVVPEGMPLTISSK